ncbi:ATP-binding cassette domain-containing protein [Paeniglutamicibacter sp. R2-26]|uniref:ATP-binding cassette domain-containing protein n=1 Tax=Paeniglutamicibacter sp. R2-26 TaxID=3144417 RepID=UPI003EE7E536
MSTTEQATGPQPLLSVTGLSVDYRMAGRRKTFKALKGVDLEIAPGECVGLVGESGSGKSTLGKAVLGLVESSGGSIHFDGRDLTGLARSKRRALADSLQVVFQDPYGSLNPSMPIGQILTEPLITSGLSHPEAMGRAREMLERVKLPADSVNRYPHEFSGGQRQRIAIARALVRKPRLVICDEPVSALDLTTQASILDLFIELQRDTGVSYLFITHDLGVVRRVCHRVAVMYHGEIVETGTGEQVSDNPSHPYTKRLLAASPIAHPQAQAERRATWLKLRAQAADGTGVAV